MAIEKSLKEEVMLYCKTLDMEHDEIINESYKRFLDEKRSDFRKKVEELLDLAGDLAK